MITVVLAAVRRRPVNLKSARVRPVWLGRETFSRSDRYETTQEGFTVWIASREQSVVDALAEPKWMVHATLLPEVLVQLREDEVADVARRAIERSTAAAQRLGYLLEGSGLPIPEPLIALRPKSAVELSPGHRAGAFSSRWRTYG
jgi:predicted transcriptional regulator of viral defense system